MDIVCHEVLHHSIATRQGPHKNCDVLTVVCADGRTVTISMFMQTRIPSPVPFSTNHTPRGA